MIRIAPLVLLAGLLAPVAAPAQDASQGTGPQPSPNVAPVPIPICTDRPTKADVACTVPKGDVQIETDLVDWSRQSENGVRTDTVIYADPMVKLGIGTHTDVEIGLPLHQTVRTHDASGVDDRAGVGDLLLRIKQRLPADDAKTQVSIIPYVQAPTAPTGVGAGGWEGGVSVPVNVPLPLKLTLALDPTVSIVTNDQGPNHHAAVTMLAQLSHGLGKKVTLYGEFWARRDLTSVEDRQQYTIDVAASYAVTKSVQVDVGENVGLNRAAPASQLYVGLSTRF